MSRVIICGIAGRMCGRIANLVMDANDLELVGGVEAAGNPNVGRDIGEVIGVGALGINLVDDLENVVEGADVVVAFTAPPDGTLEAARISGSAGKPMVVGTTGMAEEQLAAFKNALVNVPCVFAPNFSVGVTVLIKLVEEASRFLGGEYDVEVVETHHRFKTDAPSGTALALAEAAASGLGRNLSEVGVFGRSGDTGVRTREEIGIHALRAGDNVGEHSVTFGAIGETVKLSHRAHNRDTFGLGAIRAIRFATEIKPGLYDMQDVLKIVE